MIFIVLRKKSLETKNSDIIPSKKGSDHLTFAVGGGGGGSVGVERFGMVSANVYSQLINKVDIFSVEERCVI